MTNLTVFAVLFIFILNPYTVVGPLGYFLILLLYVPLVMRMRFFTNEILFFSMFLILISLIGVFSSFIHGIGQYIHLKVSLSLLIYILLAYSIYFISRQRGLCFNNLVYLSLLAVLFNSIIILIQVSMPSFRDFTESFLLPSGNVDWTEGFRFRGLASGGGASLSVLIPVAIVLALQLYSEKFIGMVQLVSVLLVLLISLFFIGRTGFLLLPVVFASFVFFNVRRYLLKVLFIFLIAVFLIVFIGDEIKEFIIGSYGMGFYNYSFGFLLEGADGLKEEGTVDIIIGFLKVMPAKFPEVLVGYGFYGGSEFYPWTDSGYSRMFLSVGYLFGVLFYLTFFLMFRHVIFYKKYLFVTIALVLLIAEAKEPLLFTGYASRVYIMLLVFALLDKKMLKHNMLFKKNDSIKCTHYVKAD